MVAALPVAAAGYVYVVYWKGWSLSDMFYVTKGSFEKLRVAMADSLAQVTAQVQKVRLAHDTQKIARKLVWACSVVGLTGCCCARLSRHCM